MAVELATAYVSLIPSARGAKAAIAKELDIDQPAEKAGKSAGGRITGALGKAVKGTIIGVGVAAGAALSAAMVKGWGRLTAIEDAQAKLEGLGHSAKAIDTIMANALGSVKGTAFGLDEAATVAASAVAAGIKPGERLERVLSLVGDTASIAGSSMGEMGAIFNKVAASNRLTMGEVNQLADRGVPILTMLADQFGVTAGEMSKMVSQGEVDFAAFSKAIETNIAGAALESGNTTRGAFANMMAAGGRFGATLLEGVFPVAKQVFGGMITLIDGATDAVKPWAEQFSTFVLTRMVPAAQQLIGNIADLAANVQQFVQSAKFQDIKAETMDRLGSIFATVATAARDLGPSLAIIVQSLARATAEIGISTWQILLTTVDALARIAAAVLVPAIQKLADWMERNQRAVTLLVGAYVAYRTAMIAVRTVTAVTMAVVGAYRAVTLGLTAASYGAAGATYAQGAALKVYAVVTKATMLATKAWAAVQWVLNAALTANPIGLIVVAIAALVAGIIIAYKRSETFRKIVDGALQAVGAAAKWLWERAIKPAWEGIKAAFLAVAAVVTWWWNNVTRPVLTTTMRIVKSLAALWLWAFGHVIRPAIVAAQIYIRALGAVISWLWTNAFRPAVLAISAVIDWLWERSIKPGFERMTRAALWLWERGIKPAFEAIGNTIRKVWSGIIKPTFDKMMSIAGRMRSTFKKAFGAIGGFISGAFDSAVGIIRGAINAVIRLINRAVRTINSKVITTANKIPGVDFPSIPTIPQLAEGGIVPATPGGRVVRVAEAGQAEAIIPLDKLERLVGGGGSGGGAFEGNLYLDSGQLLGIVRGEIRDSNRQTKRRVLAGTGAAR